MSLIAVVTGGSKGIGAAVVDALVKSGQCLVVIFTSRTAAPSNAAGAVHRSVDHGDLKAVQEFATWVLEKYERVDVLVNNAGVFEDAGKTLQEVDMDVMERTMRVNAYSALVLMKAFLPGMAKQGFGRVVNVSSGMGHQTTMAAEGRGASIAYRASKACLNTFTLTAHHEYPTVSINAVCPGFVHTDMTAHLVGLPGIQLSTPEEGADTIVWLALAPASEHRSGLFWRRRAVVPW